MMIKQLRGMPKLKLENIEYTNSQKMDRRRGLSLGSPCKEDFLLIMNTSMKQQS